MQTLIQALRRSAGVATLCCLALVSARADEGLWLFSHPPREALRQAHGFELTDAWLDHAMKASVRFGGASGSFVSADGLVLTNHHVGRSAIQRLSTATRNLEGVSGRTTIDAQRNASKPAVIVEVRNGSFRFVQAVEP